MYCDVIRQFQIEYYYLKIEYYYLKIEYYYLKIEYYYPMIVYISSKKWHHIVYVVSFLVIIYFQQLPFESYTYGVLWMKIKAPI